MPVSPSVAGSAHELRRPEADASTRSHGLSSQRRVLPLSWRNTQDDALPHDAGPGLILTIGHILHGLEEPSFGSRLQVYPSVIAPISIPVGQVKRRPFAFDPHVGYAARKLLSYRTSVGWSVRHR